jgi:ribosomal protein L24E
MPECAYSGKEIIPTEGIMLVRNNGERLYFASSKELKNWKKDRKHKYPEKDDSE